jgi:hypothetical protein
MEFPEVRKNRAADEFPTAQLPGPRTPSSVSIGQADPPACGIKSSWKTLACKDLPPLWRIRSQVRRICQLTQENRRLRRELELLGENRGIPPVERVDELGGNRQRLQQLEETLKALDPQALENHPDLLDSLRVVERSLERIWREMEPDVTEKELRRLVVETMRLSLDLWAESTRSSKAELARRSGQWSVYVNQDGWERTQGLDRYLDMVTLPDNPRMKKVLCTGDFVVRNCSESSPLRQRLEKALEYLRALH